MQLQGHLLVEMLFVGWARCLLVGALLAGGRPPHQQVTLLLPSDPVVGGSVCTYRVICRGESGESGGEPGRGARGGAGRAGERGSGSGE